MSALSDFIQELHRQADLLEWANGRDDACQALEPPDRRHGLRRQWTRQDGNRAGWSWELDDHNVAVKDLPPTEVFPSWQEFDRKWAGKRMRTRVDWFLRKFDRTVPSLADLRTLALAEAVEDGTYNTLSPMIVAAWRAQQRLLKYYREELLWDKVEPRRTAIIEKLTLYLYRPQDSAEIEAAREKRNTKWVRVHALLDADTSVGSWGKDSDKRHEKVAEWNRIYGDTAGWVRLTGDKLREIINGRERSKPKEAD